MSRGRIVIGVLAGALLLGSAPAAGAASRPNLRVAVKPAVAAPRAVAEPSTGMWSGTITLTSSGTWDYTIGYRGLDERTGQGSSSHELSWTVTLDQLRGNSEFANFVDEEDGSVALTQFSWSGEATNAGQSDCSYAANGSMTGSAPGGLSFHGVEPTGSPAIAGEGSVPIPLSLSRSDCGPGIIFGFSGPNAATLWDGGGYDVLLLNRTDVGPSHEPRMSLCSEPETLDRVAAPQTDANGHTVVRATAAGSCSGRRVEWFGDSDVYHDSTVNLTYTYDLAFQPDVASCSDGIDNDGDGAVDNDGGDDGAGDPGCVSETDPSEFGEAECDNGIDDDDNGRIDFRRDGTGDAGCESLTDTTELSDGCASVPAAGRHYTTLDVPTRLNVAVAPDPDLGTLHMGIPWCMTPQGPRIMTRPDTPSDPYGWWDGSTNWLLLGGLEWFGVTVDTPPEPTVVYGNVSATVTTSLQANVNTADAILSAVPVGKLFKPLKKGIGKYAGDLNPLVKQLDRFHGKVGKATKRMKASGLKVRKARAEVAEVRQRIVDAQQALDAAATGSERSELKRRLTELKRTEHAAKGVERIHSADYQDDIRELRRTKADEERLARKVDKILKKVRKLDEEVLKFKKQVRKAIDERVDRIHPDWAREVVQGYVEDIDRKVSGPVDKVASKLRKLSSDELLKMLKSGTASSSVVQLLKSTYTETVKKISNIKVPIWDADLTVSFDQAGRASVADNSDSRGIFTVETEPAIRTS